MKARDAGAVEKDRGGWTIRNIKGEPVYLLGVTYMPGYCGDDPWEDWRPQEVHRELLRLKELGLNCFRIFLYWHQLQPKPGCVDSDGLRKVEEHVRIAHELGVYLMPTLAGHMGVMWYPPWAEGRHFYNDREVVEGWKLMWRTIAGTFKDEPAIIAWDISNELECFALPDSRGQFRGWLKVMFDTVREADPSHPVGFGPGGDLAYSPGVLFEDAAELGDYVGVHDYPYPHIMYFKSPRNIRLTYDTPFHLAFASLGKPCMLQEYGINTLLNSEELAAACYRTAMCSCLAQGSCGFLPWSWIDYDASRIRAPGGAPPFDPEIRPSLASALIGQPLHGYLNANVALGIARGDGEWKAIAGEIAKFSRAVSALGVEHLRLPNRTAAILIQTNAQDARRGGFPLELAAYLPTYLESFILSLQAKANARIVRPDSPLDGLRLIYLPGVMDLPPQDEQRLLEWVTQGGILYCSWAGMANDLRTLFGIQPDMPVPCGSMEEMRFVRDLHGLRRGETLRYALGGSAPGLMRMSFVPSDAEIFAVDAQRRPVLVGRKVGKGQAFFCGFSPEVYRASCTEPNKGDQTCRLYRAMRDGTGEARLFDCPEPDIEIGWLEGDDAYALILVNHARERRDCHVTVEGNVARIAELLDNRPVHANHGRLDVTLESLGVALLRCERQ